MAFYAPTLNENVARLVGGVTWMRVAAHQRLAEDVGLGSVSMLFKAPKSSSQKISAPTVFSPIGAQAGSGFLPAEVEAARVFSPVDARAPSSFSPVDAQAGSGFSPCRTQAKRVFSSVDARARSGSCPQKLKLQQLLARRSPSRNVLSTRPRAHNGATHHLHHSRTTARKLLVPISSGLNPSEPEKPHRD